MAHGAREQTEIAANNADRVRKSYSLFKQPISFPRRVFCARVLLLASLPPYKGVAERRETYGCSDTRGLHVTRQARRLRGALRPITRDARLSALSPWRFWAPVPRFPHQTCVRIGYSELLASGS